jgi:hypothetical protein
VCTLLLAVFPALAGAQSTELDSLAEALPRQQLIREERQQGNAEAAWNLEIGLAKLALRNPDDVRSGRVLRDIGDQRIDILTQYDAGEFPPEIVLGCYYSGYWGFGQASRRGSQPVAVVAAGSGCTNGSSVTARRALAKDALWFYVESARILLRSEEVGGDEAQELIWKVLARSYQNQNYRTGRWGLEVLRLHQEATSASWLMQARTLALIGDWDLLFARYLGTKYSKSAATAYREALTLLREHQAAEVAVNSIFRPQTPVLLPAFGTNRLMSEQQVHSTGHVDIAFEIRDNGTSWRVKILDSSENAPRSVQRELINTIKHGRFRPFAENGRLVESAPVTVRYYHND